MLCRLVARGRLLRRSWEREAAEWLQIDVGTLANWRAQGKGPAFVKLGRGVRYRLDDLETWVSDQR